MQLSELIKKLQEVFNKQGESQVFIDHFDFYDYAKNIEIEDKWFGMNPSVNYERPNNCYILISDDIQSFVETERFCS